jgi:hypothetical protein
MITNSNPENEPGIIKFLAGQDGVYEGLRGKLLAVQHDDEYGDRGIVLAMNTPFNGLLKWGQLVLVEEDNPEEWSKFVKVVNCIPTVKWCSSDFGWEIIR